MKWLKMVIIGIVIIFAFIGILTIGSYAAISLHWTNVAGIVDTQNRYLQAPEKPQWMQSEEWQTLKKAITADTTTINKAAKDSGVNARLIVAQLVVEQLRLYTSQREIYKQIFEPLQILGVQSQFSWGVMGLKQDTAIEIEQNLSSTTSPFYLGSKYEHLLDFTTTDHDTERFNRLIDEHDHYYSYLYAGLYLQEIMTQWKNAGFDISNRPEILSTLFNIGFIHSNPNADPKVGGAEIDINGQSYSFGELAYAFYNSDELLQEFPK